MVFSAMTSRREGKSYRSLAVGNTPPSVVRAILFSVRTRPIAVRCVFDKMVNSCCVHGCHNRSNRERDRHFHNIPAVVRGKDNETEELTSNRRREWLAQLRLKDVTFDSKARRTVCSDHFVNGE